MVDRLKEAQLLREQRKQTQAQEVLAQEISEPIEVDQGYGMEQEEYGDEDWDAAIEDEEDLCMKEAKENQQAKQKLDELRTEIIIDFQPQNFEQGSIPQLCGDMTEGIPVNMQPLQDGKFQLKCKVAKGFKYRFWFVYKGKQQLDYTREVSMNHQDQPTNVIYVPKIDGEDIDMDLPTGDVNQLQKWTSSSEVPDELQSKIVDFQTDYRTQDNLYEQMLSHSALIVSIREYQALIEIANNTNDKFEVERLTEKMKNADKEFRELATVIQVAIIGRLVWLKHDPDKIFEVKTYAQNTAEITLRRIYDDYQILLQPNTTMSICLPQMNATKFQKEYHLLDRQQEIYWRKEFLTDNYIFVLKYRIAKHNGKKECLFHQIMPLRLGFDSIDHLLKHYVITYHVLTKEVTNIKNRKMGDVKFKAVKLDDGAGYQSNSTVQLWTHHNKKVFNIAHIHVNDTSDEVPIDVQYLTSHNYKLWEIPFKKDATGALLRYKILVFDWKIRDVLYNSGSQIEPVQFSEHPISLDDYQIAKGNFGKIVKVPYALLTFPDKDFVEDLVQQKESVLTKLNHCSYRSFERMLGYVDFEIYMKNDDLIEPYIVSVAICKLEKPESWQIDTYQLLQQSIQDSTTEQFDQMLAKFTELVNQDRQDIKEHLQEIKDAEESLQAPQESNEVYELALKQADQKKMKLGRAIKFMK